jgi:hypothetical protein
MDAAVVTRPRPRASELLLEHCFALGGDGARRPPAAVRLEAQLGRDFARRLVSALLTRTG